MAEGRMIKKRISESKKLGKLSSDSARLLYTWLIPWLDVEGRYTADAELLKGHLFPKVKSMTLKKIEKLLAELDSIGLITLYKYDGEIFLEFTKFHEIQNIAKTREAASKIPSPHDSSCELMRTQDNSVLNESKLNEVKLKESQTEFDNLFNQFWEVYPKKIHKQYAKEKFMILARKDCIKELTKAYCGYMDFLKYQRIDKNFPQEPMNPSTFLSKNRWKEYVDFKYKARL